MLQALISHARLEEIRIERSETAQLQTSHAA